MKPFRTENERIAAALVVAAFAITASLAVTRTPATAADPNQGQTSIIGGILTNRDTPDSLSVGQIISDASLNGDKYKACGEEIFDLFNSNLDDKVKDFVKDYVADALQQYRDQMVSYAFCRVESLLNNLCIFGDCTGGGTECSKPVASDVASYLKTTYKDRLTSTFLARCTSLVGVKTLGDTVHDVINSQGINGGPAYVSDWTTTTFTEPDRQAMRRMWAILVNTPICPYFKEAAFAYFGVPQSYIDSPPEIAPTELNTSADAPFQLRAACTLPPSYIPGMESSPDLLNQLGGFQFYIELANDQNNPAGFIAMAEAELARQRGVAVRSAINEAVAGGGFTSLYGPWPQSCMTLDPDGNCIQTAGVRQPAGAVRDIQDTMYDTEVAFWMKSDGQENKPLTDLAARLQLRVLDIAYNPGPINFEFGKEDNQDTSSTGSGNPPATGTGTGTSGALQSDDPACADISPQCSCVRNNESARRIARIAIAPAVARALAAQPGTPDVRTAICQHTRLDCAPHPGKDTEIILRIAGVTLSFDVITDQGAVRTDGGEPVAQCEAGAQN